MRRFGWTNENVKKIMNDKSDICQKVDAHAVPIKHLQQMIMNFSTIVNLCLLSTFKATLSRILRMSSIVWQSLLAA